DDIADAEASHQHVADEVLGLHACQRGVEAELVEPLDPEPFQDARLLGRGGQAEGRRFRLKMAAGVRLERDDAEGRLARGTCLARVADQYLMAQMHAVEIADGSRGAAVVGGEVAVAVDQSHGPPFSPSRARWPGLGGALPVAPRSRRVLLPTPPPQSSATVRHGWRGASA